MTATTTLTVRMQGKTHVSYYDKISDADLAVRRSANKHGFAVLPDCTETGEDLGRGKIIQVRTKTTFGTYEIS